MKFCAIKSFAAAVCVVLLGFVAACGPSIQPQMKAATDALLAKPHETRTVAASSALEPKPWKVGQWIMARTLNDKQEPAVMKISIVGEEGGGLWIETEIQDFYQHNVSKVLYSRQPKNKDDAGEVVRKIVSKKDDEKVQVIDLTDDSPGVALMKGMMKSMLSGVYVSVTPGAVKENVTVPAGTFAGCAAISATAKFGPSSTETKSWFHPEAPINGVVKSISAKGDWTYELLAYGTTGATSVLP